MRICCYFSPECHGSKKETCSYWDGVSGCPQEHMNCKPPLDPGDYVPEDKDALKCDWFGEGKPDLREFDKYGCVECRLYEECRVRYAEKALPQKELKCPYCGEDQVGTLHLGKTENKVWCPSCDSIFIVTEEVMTKAKASQKAFTVFVSAEDGCHTVAEVDTIEEAMVHVHEYISETQTAEQPGMAWTSIYGQRVFIERMK